MADVQIGTMETTLELEPEPAGSPAAIPTFGEVTSGGPADALRLRELLRPLVLEVLEDELARYTRIRG